MLEILPRDSSTDTCQTTSDYNGHQNLRILSVFIILISSGLGVYFPILASRYSFIRLPDWCFFLAKFFGSGVIVATAFIHLLEPASDALGDDCLGGTFAEYPWAFGICLMSLFLLFFTEIVTHHFVTKAMGDDHGHHNDVMDLDSLGSSSFTDADDIRVIYNREVSNINVATLINSMTKPESFEDNENNTNIIEEDYKYDLESGLHNNLKISDSKKTTINANKSLNKLGSVPGTDHFAHDDDHQDASQLGTPINQEGREQYLNQIFSVTILEFGIIFHSVFVGLSLSVSGEEFETLFVVLTFHQMFEGLGLGTRVAETHWPQNKKYIPWLMGFAFTITAPIAAAIGIGVRNSFLPGSRTALITNGVFDSISAGILIYTGLVELMAHEFLYSNQFKGPDGFKKMLSAYFVMCLGAALMAVLGKWA